MSYQQITPPDDRAIDVELVKQDLRADGDELDGELELLIDAATEEIESDCRRQFVEAEFTLRLDQFPTGCGSGGQDVLIERCPVVSIDEIRYLDAAGTQQTLAASNYRADVAGEPARVSPAYGLSWPVTRRVSNAVEIDFTAGYGTQDDVPKLAQQALRARVAEMFRGCENGGAEALKHRLKWGAEWRK